MVTLEQERARDALEKVTQFIEKTSDKRCVREKYVSYVRSLPATVLTNGLGQAVASLQSAAKGSHDDPHYILYRHLEAWLCRDHVQAPYRRCKNLLDAITSHDCDTYILAQAEALAWLGWLKKFAVAYIGTEESEGDV